MNLFGFDTEKHFYYENGFYLTSEIKRIAKLIAHYEIYKKIIKLPGEIVECGVFKGASLIRFATFRDILESPYSRKIIGFDIFGKFPHQKNEDDAKYAKEHDEVAGFGIPVEDLHKVFELKKIVNYQLIKGDINNTVPEFIIKNPFLKISLLHVDVDVYDSTMTVLKNFYERVVRGGIIVLDDFATVSGATKAIDDFFIEKNVSFHKYPFAHIPSYIIKN